MGIGEAAAARDSAASRKGSAAHETRGPDVTVDPTLVAKAICQPGLAEQFVKIGMVRCGNLGANLGNLDIEVRGGLSLLSGHGDADGSKERVR